QSEIVALATQVSESVPAIPGLTALVILLIVNIVLRRTRPSATFTRAEMLTVFLFVTVASTIMGIGVTQFLFALITTPFYFTEDHIAENRPFMPSWLVPHDLTAIRHLYERDPNGIVPWQLWAGPAAMWLLFFLALWCALYCMMALFYRIWNEEERLSFPQVFIPLEMTDNLTSRTPFFRNRLMWSGFIVAALYNLINIWHALNPAVPAIGKNFDIGVAFTVSPWSEIAPLKFEFRPELVGLGYLVSTEISLTAWLAYALEKAAAVIGVSMGATPGALPYSQEQGIGAYLVLAILLCWLSRQQIARLVRLAITGGGADGPEGLRIRWTVAGLIGGFLAVWSFMALAGMAAWVAFVYLVLVMAVALVYGRLRAEAGVPLVWLFPYYMQKRALLYAFGSTPFVASGAATMPVWALFTFLARGYYPALTGYQVEGMELGRRAGIKSRHIAVALLLAVVIGVLCGWYNHLTPYYHYGATQLRGGIWGEWIATPEYAAAVKVVSTPMQPDGARIIAMLTGAGFGFLLWALRLRFAGFPLHPLGYVMACSYGSLIWGSFLVVWILKSLALRYGGMRFYRETVPFFLGLAFGHFAIAGILWGLTGAWTGDAVQGYPVFFG
ncbi:MAG TPA: DUF6785 family protein, partial [Chthonomonadaceae bacterium]|nr:DUF6785 family protein [Chthonomonadaceae bacterium]